MSGYSDHKEVAPPSLSEAFGEGLRHPSRRPLADPKDGSELT
jgi:hypothetical protein